MTTRDPTLRQEIREFLVGYHFFDDPNGRKALLLSANLDVILPKIELTGTPQEFVTLLVNRLDEYGALSDGTPSLVQLLQHISTQVGTDKHVIITGFCDRLQAESQAAQRPDATSTPTTKVPQVFLCYAREDAALAKRLYADLKAAGLSPWMDTEDLLPGQKWKHLINEALKRSSYVLILLSTRALSKQGFIQNEMRKALDVVESLPPDAIFVIPVRLDKCIPTDERLQELHWVDLFPSYDAGLRRILCVFPQVKQDNPKKSSKPQISQEETIPKQSEEGRPEKKQIAPKPLSQQLAMQKLSSHEISSATVIRLRSQPAVLEKEVMQELGLMVDDKAYSFRAWRPVEYIQNMYEDQGEVVIDHITRLMWQKSGSPNYMNYQETQAYITQLNVHAFADHNDWRLPTIPELISLLETKEQSNDLYVNPLFDSIQKWCWSADKSSSGVALRVDFNHGNVSWDDILDDSYVRAVRSSNPAIEIQLSKTALSLLEKIQNNTHSPLKGISLVTERSGGWFVPYIFYWLSNEEISKNKRERFDSDRDWSKIQDAIQELIDSRYLSSYSKEGSNRTIEKILLVETKNTYIEQRAQVLLEEIKAEEILPDSPPYKDGKGITIVLDEYNAAVGRYVCYFHDPYKCNILKDPNIANPPYEPIIEVRLAAEKLAADGFLKRNDKLGLKYPMERYEYIAKE
jgi:hypothetical protein